jgi:heat shock protein HslJ
MRTFLQISCVMVILLGGCQGRTGQTSPVITDRLWTLKELEGQPLDSRAAANPPTLMLTSSDSHVSGNAGCNRMAGTYTLGAGTLAFGPLAMTRMACPAMELETRFTSALAAIRQYRVETNQLLLVTDGRVVARFDPPPAR